MVAESGADPQPKTLGSKTGCRVWGVGKTALVGTCTPTNAIVLKYGVYCRGCWGCLFPYTHSAHPNGLGSAYRKSIFGNGFGS
ncbi:hypothetical protein [Nostoc sp. FACHB-152]|uniref:hypothetical protein n=1 Tax=Nostoc sp. FACHB-152 TaxID=2692837 RepID=UPI00168374EC|nr:hypothetical protein [Nostoc sp. FACHB-152]